MNLAPMRDILEYWNLLCRKTAVRVLSIKLQATQTVRQIVTVLHLCIVSQPLFSFT